MGDGLDLSSSEYLLSFSLYCHSLHNPSPGICHASGHPLLSCCADNDVITQDAAPVSCLPCPRSPDFSSLYSLSLPGDASVMAPAWVSTLLISTPGHKNLLSLGWVLSVINTPEYKMELINRCCYYLQRAAQESNEASL